MFFETSAKNSANISKSFYNLGKLVLDFNTCDKKRGEGIYKGIINRQIKEK